MGIKKNAREGKEEFQKYFPWGISRQFAQFFGLYCFTKKKEK